MGIAEWVIEVDEELKTMVASETEMKHWMKRSIYKVPPNITDLLDPMWQDDDHKFMQLMILDGCFMLEILRFDTHTMEDYAETDPIFSNHGKIHIIPFIKRDMLMLENQLPMQLLHSLVAVDSNGTKVIPSLWTHY
ncbi:hypothetical protein Goshw_008011 [Gossypium schwendimanii]|uniref:Uncharacterized protein n=1 Tax=Gossypium schwendimanii TaxID=34291 RepID=A0A7J9N0X5_GOSSC|nr:hypothetical protein [Gossypium schwendimanii]